MCTLGILFALCTILLHTYYYIDLDLITRGAGFGYFGSVIPVLSLQALRSSFLR